MTQMDAVTIYDVQRATVVLTNEQIKTLPSVGQILVPAQGANTIIIPIACLLDFNIVARYAMADYTQTSLQLLLADREISGIYPMRLVSTDVGSTGRLISRLPVDAKTSAADNDPLFASMITSSTISPGTGGINAALSIKDDFNGVPDYTGGDPSNSLTVTVLYSVLDID